MYRVLACTALALASCSSALAAPVGVTVDASTTVTGAGPGGSRQIVRDAAIFSDDRLRADLTGNAQIVLADETRIIVGPGADVKIDSFVFDSARTFEKLTIRATKGAFRFISGASKSAAYRINTPAGTIGVRGTKFDVQVGTGPDGRPETKVVVVDGEVELCPREGERKNGEENEECVPVGGLCTLAVLREDEVEEEGDLRRQPKAEKANFPLMEQEDELNEDFRFAGVSCIGQLASAPGMVIPAIIGGGILTGIIINEGDDGGGTGGGDNPASN